MSEYAKLFEELLVKMISVRASDLHIKTGLPPVVRVSGALKSIGGPFGPLSQEQMHGIFEYLLKDDEAMKSLKSGKEKDMAYVLEGSGRFRLNLFKHKGEFGLVGRFVPIDIPELDSLMVPGVLKKAVSEKNGIILLNGATGNGKSTTLASMLDYRNQNMGGHIVTIENPIEYVIRDRKALVTQREVGIDTESFKTGLKSVLRQDPDVIMIGELRDRETMKVAIDAAETGHLVLSTMHTTNALESILRFIGSFEGEEQKIIRMQMASTLLCICCQRLIPVDGANNKKKMVPATEMLTGTMRVKEAILDPQKVLMLPEIIESSQPETGMHSFDQDLQRLISEGYITEQRALSYCTNPNDFKLRLRGIRNHG